MINYLKICSFLICDKQFAGGYLGLVFICDGVVVGVVIRSVEQSI